MVDDKLLKAIQDYKGPITKCPSGRVDGAGDLGVWAVNRASGGSGVPEKEVWERRKAYFRRLSSKPRKVIKQHSSERVNPPMFEDGDTTGPPPWDD